MIEQFGSEDWVKSDGKGGVHIGEAHVRAAEVASFVALIYRVAGGQGPIILPRVKVNPNVESGAGWRVRNHGGALAIHLDHALVLDEARTLAAVMASMVDLAEHREAPDPEQVKALAEFLDRTMDTAPDELAVQLLRHFNITERAA